MGAKVVLIALLVAGLMLLASCSNGNPPVTSNPGSSSGASTSPSATSRPVAAERPTVTRVPTGARATVTRVSAGAQPNPTTGASKPSDTGASLGPVLFQDDFSDTSSGWANVDLDTIGVNYDSGEYRAAVKKENISSFAALPDRDFDDVSVEADARLASGPNLSVFGLLCRATAGDVLQTGYEFLITGAGGYGVLKVSGPGAGQQHVLGSESTSSVIHPGTATNHLRADCSGDHLVFYVNGQKIADHRDSGFKSGQVGFAFSTLKDNNGFEVRFDNFTVRQSTP